MKKLFIGLLALASAYAYANHEAGALVHKNNLFPQVKLETNFGDIVIELDRADTPIASNNFIYYVHKKSYDETVFHRVINGFVVQGGGYDLDYKPKPSAGKIFNESGNGKKNEPYTIAMARESAPHSATRQFYFNVEANTNLDPDGRWGYTVFGYVVEGEEVIDQMAQVETHVSPILGWPDVPVEPIVLKKAYIVKPKPLK